MFLLAYLYMCPSMQLSCAKDEDGVPPPVPPRPPKPKASEYEFLDTGEEFQDAGEQGAESSSERVEAEYQNVMGDGAEDSAELLGGKEEPAAGHL